MSRIFIPILILLWSLLYSWFWNCGFGDYQRRPLCNSENAEATYVAAEEPEAVVEPEVEMTEEEKLLFNPIDVYFASGEANIKQSADLDKFLETAKAYLEQNPDKKLSLVGNTDSDGGEEINMPLSIKRAERVKTILINSGFKANNLETSGNGATQPKADNSTAEGKAQNRRVSIRLIN